MNRAVIKFRGGTTVLVGPDGTTKQMEMMEDGTRVLISYATAVAKITPDGRLVRLCGYERECSSQTTMRHLVAFCVTNGLPKISLKEWNSMPREA